MKDGLQEKNNVILLIINSLQGGGAERSVLTLGEGFLNLGYEVHILCFDPTVAYDLNTNLSYHLVEYQPFRALPNNAIRFRVFSKVVDNYVKKYIGIPLLTLSNLDRADRVMRYSKLPNVIHIIRNTLSKKIELLSPNDKNWTVHKMKEVYSRFPKVCISQGVAKDFNKTLSIYDTSTIYNPIDAKNINILAEAFNPEIKNYIVHVGSFKEQKAHDVLIKAYAKTSQKLPLVLIGSGKLLEASKKLVYELDLIEKVLFMGFKKNPYPFIKHAEFMVLTSNFEGFGRVIAEALSIDTPVISTDCPSGPRELLPENNLMQTGNIDAIATKLTQAMQNPRQFSVKFDDSLLPDVIAQQYLKVLKSTS